ncbi:MAG: hypothetical protein F4X82_01780 [Candidatus Spechtbacteria bacterium SB0662_bin_43]|uniref:Chitin-binding type-3 domain-containing protein n=1 Tax=Candidatus Spechtbacteria bacterium SB0662_bin_43 TaxID=2604897 RepID=A0A845D9R4_9BACT|nr:hypothetical protein [Candidatus Spechtbacteria bacterium SB0662_bin_43]
MLRTLTGKLTKPNGDDLANSEVVIRLIDNATDAPVIAPVNTLDSTTVSTEKTTFTDDEGNFTCELIPNNLIANFNTRYIISVNGIEHSFIQPDRDARLREVLIAQESFTTPTNTYGIADVDGVIGRSMVRIYTDTLDATTGNNRINIGTPNASGEVAVAISHIGGTDADSAEETAYLKNVRPGVSIVLLDQNNIESRTYRIRSTGEVTHGDSTYTLFTCVRDSRSGDATFSNGEIITVNFNFVDLSTVPDIVVPEGEVAFDTAIPERSRESEGEAGDKETVSRGNHRHQTPSITKQTTNPTGSEGQDDDIIINTQTNVAWKKVSGTWEKLWEIGDGTGGAFDSKDFFVHLGTDDIDGTKTGLDSAVTGDITITGARENVWLPLQFQNVSGENNVPDAATYSTTTGELVLPQGQWIVCISTKIEDKNIQNNRAYYKALGIEYDGKIRHANSGYGANQTNVGSETELNDIQGLRSVTGVVDSDGSKSIRGVIKLVARNDNEVIHITGAHLHAVKVFVADTQGEPGNSTYTQYSVDSMTWVDTFQPGTGIQYMRQASGITKPANDSADWTPAIRIVGEGGATGLPGLTPANANRGRWIMRNINNEEYGYTIPPMKYHGTYNASRSYVYGDVVVYEGKMYILETASTAQVITGQQPDTSTVWVEIAIEVGSEQVQSDWDETDTSSDAYIQNKPTIPAAQVQSDWEQTDDEEVDYIKNKPSIPKQSRSLVKFYTRVLPATHPEFDLQNLPNTNTPVSHGDYRIKTDNFETRFLVDVKFRAQQGADPDGFRRTVWELNLDFPEVEDGYDYYQLDALVIDASESETSAPFINFGKIDPEDVMTVLSDDDPEDVGETAEPGTSPNPSRGDHTHKLGEGVVKETNLEETLLTKINKESKEVTEVTGDTTLTTTNIGEVVSVTTSSTNITLTMPSNPNNGDTITILKADAGDGGVTIVYPNNTTIYTLTVQHQAVQLVFDGTFWDVFGEANKPANTTDYGDAIEALDDKTRDIIREGDKAWLLALEADGQFIRGGNTRPANVNAAAQAYTDGSPASTLTGLAQSAAQNVLLRVPTGTPISQRRFNGARYHSNQYLIGTLNTWDYWWMAIAQFPNGAVILEKSEDVYRWQGDVTKDAVYDQAKEILKQGDNITVTEDDDTQELTIAGTGSGGGFEGTYAAATTYNVGSIVEYQSRLWISLEATNTGNTPTDSIPAGTTRYWELLGRRHIFTEWMSGHSYTEGTIVEYLNLYYLCIQTINNSTATPNTDASHWRQVFVGVQESRLIPAGGTTGQALIKAGDADYATEWGNVSSGGDDEDITIVPVAQSGQLQNNHAYSLNVITQSRSLDGVTREVATAFSLWRFNADNTVEDGEISQIGLFTSGDVGSRTFSAITVGAIEKVGNNDFLIVWGDSGCIEYITYGRITVDERLGVAAMQWLETADLPSGLRSYGSVATSSDLATKQAANRRYISGLRIVKGSVEQISSSDSSHITAFSFDVAVFVTVDYADKAAYDAQGRVNDAGVMRCYVYGGQFGAGVISSTFSDDFTHGFTRAMWNGTSGLFFFYSGHFGSTNTTSVDSIALVDRAGSYISWGVNLDFSITVTDPDTFDTSVAAFVIPDTFLAPDVTTFENYLGFISLQDNDVLANSFISPAYNTFYESDNPYYHENFIYYLVNIQGFPILKRLDFSHRNYLGTNSGAATDLPREDLQFSFRQPVIGSNFNRSVGHLTWTELSATQVSNNRFSVLGDTTSILSGAFTDDDYDKNYFLYDNETSGSDATIYYKSAFSDATLNHWAFEVLENDTIVARDIAPIGHADIDIIWSSSQSSAGVHNNHIIQVREVLHDEGEQFLQHTGTIRHDISYRSLYIVSSDVTQRQENGAQVVTRLRISLVRSGGGSGGGSGEQSDWDETDTSSEAYIKNKPTIPEVFGSNTIRKDDQNHLRLKAPDLNLGLWGRSADDAVVPLGSDDPANAVPVRLTEVRSNDTRTTAKLSDVAYEATGPQGNPEVVGTIKVLHNADTTITSFGTGAGYDATKPGFTWDQANNRFAHNGVAATTANSGSNTNKFRLRVEVDYKHHMAVGSDEANLRLELDVPVKFGVDRQHDWRNIDLDFNTTEIKTLSYQVDIQSTEAPATTDHMTVRLRSLQLGSQVLFVEAVRIHFILPDSANVSYLQEYDLSNPVTWVFGRRLLGPALGSHTNNQTMAGVRIDGGRLEATEDLAVLQLILNARTGVAGAGHNIRLMTRIPGLQAPTILHEWDDSTNVWRVVQTVKAVVKGQEFYVEVDPGATYSSVGSPNFVWDSTKHDSDEDNTLLYPGLIAVMTEAEYNSLSFKNPYQLYALLNTSNNRISRWIMGDGTP